METILQHIYKMKKSILIGLLACLCACKQTVPAKSLTERAKDSVTKWLKINLPDADNYKAVAFDSIHKNLTDPPDTSNLHIESIYNDVMINLNQVNAYIKMNYPQRVLASKKLKDSILLVMKDSLKAYKPLFKDYYIDYLYRAENGLSDSIVGGNRFFMNSSLHIISHIPIKINKPLVSKTI